MDQATFDRELQLNRQAYETLRELRQAPAAGKLPPLLGPGDVVRVLSREGDYNQDVGRYLR